MLSQSFDTINHYATCLTHPKSLRFITVSYKINRNRMAHKISLKMYNLTGNEEFDGYYYNYRNDQSEIFMNVVAIPDISYKIEF